MNKELINKYQKEFLHWIKKGDKSVLIKSAIGWTGIANESNWQMLDNDLIVINDEFVKERIAAAEGKQLQVSYDNGKHWYDKSARKISWSDSQMVRIKPEELDYKLFHRDEIPRGICFSKRSMRGSYYEDTQPGEKKHWHVYDENGILYRSSVTPTKCGKEYYISDRCGNPIIKQKSVFKEGDWVVHHHSPVPRLLTGNFMRWLTIDYDLWEPKTDDWCLFKKCNNDPTALERFSHLAEGTSLYTSRSGKVYNICEPFTGILPHHLATMNTQKNK